MCTWNGWKKAGVVNGAQGTACDIIYGEGQRPPNIPFAILMRFKTASKGIIYRGPSYVAVLDCTRTHFPLDLAYATTIIHKSQGPILPLVSIREKGHSLSAVVLLRGKLSVRLKGRHRRGSAPVFLTLFSLNNIYLALDRNAATYKYTKRNLELKNKRAIFICLLAS